MLARASCLGSSAGQVVRACFSTIQDKKETLKALNSVVAYLNGEAKMHQEQSKVSLQGKASAGAVSLREEGYYRILAEHLESEEWKLKVELESKTPEKSPELGEALKSVTCRK